MAWPWRRSVSLVVGVLLLCAGYWTTLTWQTQLREENYRATVSTLMTQLNIQAAHVREKTLAADAARVQQEMEWIKAYDAHEQGLRQWQKALADRISQRYQIAPQAALLLVQQSDRAARAHQIDPVLLMAVVAVESRFNPYVVSRVGAIGLTQTLPSAHPIKIQTMRDQGGSLINPKDNLHMGATILAEYLKMSHGNRVQALQRYNGALKDREARYAHKVLRVYDFLRVNLPAVPPLPTRPSQGEQLASMAG